jgi:aerobic-type carbon monoxide dehydrogenase small subunit (CoxS/CutS family)
MTVPVSDSAREVSLVVNGIRREVVVDPATPLLWVLRTDFGLTGVRFGCGLGQCGACTVIVDGIARQSCDLPVSAVEGCHVTTIEGLGSDGELDPLQTAFIEEGAAQCGYCTAGIIVAARALLDAEPAASDARIREALAGNLCRCGAHARVMRAIHRVADGGTA